MTTPQDDHNLRRLVLRMYWDGEETPSVVSPIAETTATVWCPRSRDCPIRAATLRTRSASASELPPYFCTTRDNAMPA